MVSKVQTIHARILFVQIQKLILATLQIKILCFVHIFSYFVIKGWKVREPRGLHSIFPLSLLWGGTSLAATVPQHTTTLDSAEKYIVNTSLRLREFWKLLLVKMSLLFSYWCVGLYQWGGRTDKDNDKVKINGKPFVFLTMGVNVDFSNF